MLPSKFADLGLHHPAQRKQSAAELVLGQSKQEVGLILGAVGWTLKQPPPKRLIKLDPGVVTGSQGVGSNLLGHNQKLIKLQMVVAKTARDGSATRKILLDERAHHIALKPLLVIDHVIRNADGLGDAARVVNIVQRAATALH